MRSPQLRRIWTLVFVLAGLLAIVGLLLRTGSGASRSRRAGASQDAAVDANPGRAPAEEAGDAPPRTGEARSTIFDLQAEEAAALAPLLGEQVRRLERLRDAGRVGEEAVLVARIEEALCAIPSAPASERWRLFRSTDDWARELRRRTALLYDAGRLSAAERDEGERALDALRAGEAWLLSPGPQFKAPPASADTSEGVAEVRARHLRRQLEAIAGATEPDLAILRLMLQARLGDTPFDVARAEAVRQLDRIPPASRAAAESLVALFDWYGWARLRELEEEPR
jgi:hypothetical protein